MSTNYLIRPPRISEASSHLQTSLAVQPPLPWTKVIEKNTRWQPPWFVWNSLIGLLVNLLNWSPTLWQMYRLWPVTFLVLAPGQVTSGHVTGCPPCSGRGEVCNTVNQSCECDTGYYITSSSPANDTSADIVCEEGGRNISSLTRGLVTTLIIVTATSQVQQFITTDFSSTCSLSFIPCCVSLIQPCLVFYNIKGWWILSWKLAIALLVCKELWSFITIENDSLTVSQLHLFCVL